MKFIIENEIYDVWFKYVYFINHKDVEKREIECEIKYGTPPIKTYCFISKKIGDKQYELVSEGVSIQNKLDKFDKKLGRKLAFKRALDSRFFTGNFQTTGDIYENIFTKEQRMFFWEEYFRQITLSKLEIKINEYLKKKED